MSKGIIGAIGGVHLGRVDRSGEKMESSPRLGLGTKNIVLLCKD